MKKFVLAVVAAVLMCVGLSASDSYAAVGSWQKGISIQSRSAEDFGSVTFRQSVDNAAKNGVNYITLVVPVHQDNIRSSYVYTSHDTPTDSALRSGLAYLKSKSISAAIAIHNNPYDYQWRAFIKADNKDEWFKSYGALVSKYASIGQQTGVDQMIIGTELSSMTVPENTSYWNQLIKNVRNNFSGSLTYSAQRTGYMSDAQSLGFWPNLDKIGISAYYGLGNDGSIQSMKDQWVQWDQQEISVLAKKYNKPVVFTEVGYVSRDGATVDPGTGYNLTTNLNPTLQANAYQALFEYWQNSSSLAGVFFWDWSSDPNAGGNNDGGYTPQNKPAEAVMKKWFGSESVPGTPPTPTEVSISTQSTLPKSSNVNTQMTVPVSFRASSPANGVLVDIEVYDEKNTKVAQAYFENQSLTTSYKNYSLNWTPKEKGKYTVKVGVFTANWAKNLFWSNDVGAFQVVTPAPVQPTPVPEQPAPTPPTPTPTPTQPPTPQQPTTPSPSPQPQPTAISIWWPGGTVSGLQPYKAVIDGRDINTYDIYWQVDGGVLNKLGDDPTPVPHKESLVDMTNWSWNKSGNYTINFVAKDKSGKVLSQKSMVISVVR